MIVDVRKLDEVRGLIDECAAESAIACDGSIVRGLIQLAESLGYSRLECHESGCWYVAFAETATEQQRALRIYLKHGPERAATYEARVRARTTCCALTLYDALLACVCRLVAPEVDIALSANKGDGWFSNEAPHPPEYWGEMLQYEWADVESVMSREELTRLR